jgi:AsmA protein
VNTAALWGGAIQVTRIEAIAPVIQLERSAAGQGNWELLPTSATTESTGGGANGATAAPAFSLESLAVSDGAVTFTDHISNTQFALQNITATAQLDAVDGPAAFDMSAVMNGQDFSLKGDLGDLMAFLSDGASTAVASGSVGGSSFEFDGRAGLVPLALGGATRIDLNDADAIFALIGIPAPDLPRGFGGERMGLQAELTYTETGLTLRNAALRLDDNTFTGDLDAVLTGECPQLTARLSAGVLDFSSLAQDGSSGGGSGGAQSSNGWPRDTIDVSALQSLDADIALSALGLDLGLIKLGETRTRTTLTAGRAVTEITRIAAYDGAIAGSFVVNSRGGFSARANLQASNVAIQPLMQDLAGYERLIATGDVTLNLLGVGNSVDVLMKSIECDVAARFGKGELLGLDLVGMLRNLDPSFVGAGQSTIFDGLSGSFAIANGVATNSDLALDARLLTASGQGTVDLGGQMVDYRLRPKLLEDQTGGGLAVPVKITGPWTSPRFQLDLEALAKEELADEIEAVKAEGERVILQKIEEETGVSAGSLGELEDKARDEIGNRVEEAIENEVGNALRGLLGR